MSYKKLSIGDRLGTEKLKKTQSKKYEGVRSKELNDGDIVYYVRFTKDCKRYELKVGTKNTGWNDKKAFLKKAELENKSQNLQCVKFEDAMNRFFELQQIHLKESSFRAYVVKSKNLECLFDKDVSSINQKDINDITIKLSQRLSNKTINEIISILKQVLKFAGTEYGIKNTNLEGLKRLKVDNQRERFLSIDEIVVLKNTLQNDDELLLFVSLSLSTGARLASVLNIRKKDINIQNKTINLRDFKNSSNYQGYLRDEVIDLILKRWDNLGENDCLIKIYRGTIEKKMRIVFEKLFNQGINDRKHKVVIHTLRHTFASRLAIAGASIQIIQKLLNHKDIQMTLRYAHLSPDAGRDWVMRLGI